MKTQTTPPPAAISKIMYALQGIKIDHTDFSDDGYNQLCSKELKLIESVLTQELTALVEASRKEILEEVREKMPYQDFEGAISIKDVISKEEVERFLQALGTEEPEK